MADIYYDPALNTIWILGVNADTAPAGAVQITESNYTDFWLTEPRFEAAIG